MKYYKVTAMGGHVGSGNIIPLIFYFKSQNIYNAIKKARNMPCVKHNKSNAIIDAKEISEEEYMQGIKEYSAYDIYNNK